MNSKKIEGNAESEKERNNTVGLTPGRSNAFKRSAAPNHLSTQ
jgi:hypothetical protein